MRMRLLSLTILLFVVTACSGVGDPDPGDATASTPPATASPTPTMPHYFGTPLPRLGERPAWAVKRSVDEAPSREVLPFGKVVAVAVIDSDLDSRGRVVQFELLDASSGEPLGKLRLSSELATSVRQSVERDERLEAWTGMWQGQPALYVSYTTITTGDALTKETRTRGIDAYGEDRQLLGTTTVPYETRSGSTQRMPSLHVINGWRLLYDSQAETTSIAKPDTSTKDQVVIPSVCGTLSDDCFGNVSDNLLRADEGAYADVAILMVAGNIAFQVQPRDPQDPEQGACPASRPGQSECAGRRLVAVDLTTGTPAWTSDSITTPEGVPDARTLGGLNAIPAAAFDDKLIVHWRQHAGPDTEPQPTVIGIHDLSTGALLASGPTLELSAKDESYHYVGNSDGTVVVLYRRGASGSTALDLASGDALWQQGAGEKPLEPHAIIGDVLYGSVSDQNIAVSLTDKKVLVENLADLPQPLPHGGALVETTSVLFSFQPD